MFVTTQIEHGDDEWQVGIVGAFTRLQLTVNNDYENETEAARAIESAHKQFHVELISACRSPRLMQLQDIYYDHACRYRQLFIHEVHKVPHIPEFLANHEQLMQLALDRNIEEACSQVSKHLDITLNTYIDADN